MGAAPMYCAFTLSMYWKRWLHSNCDTSGTYRADLGVVDDWYLFHRYEAVSGDHPHHTDEAQTIQALDLVRVGTPVHVKNLLTVGHHRKGQVNRMGRLCKISMLQS
jgi:hypothetical protein